MTYTLSGNLTTEKDKAQTQPTELYDFFLGLDQEHPDANTLHWVNYPQNLDFFNTDGNAQEYTSWAFRRSPIARSMDNDVDECSIEIDNVSNDMRTYAQTYDLRGKRVVIRLMFRNLVAAAADTKIIFDGFIDAIDFSRGKCLIRIVAELGSLKLKTGRLFQIKCPWTFGDIECNYDYDLLTNHSFEDATGDVPDDWVKSAGTITQEELPYPVDNGEEVIKHVADDTQQFYQVVTGSTAADGEYYFQIYVRGTGTCKLFFYDDVDTTQYGSAITLSSSWQKQTLRKTFGTGSTVRRVGIEATADSSTVYADTARLDQVHTADSGGSTTTIVDAALTQADDYWNYGMVEFLTGDNAGYRRHVIDFATATDTATLDWALANAVATGDKYYIRRGCDKTLARCDTTFSNSANYGGFHTIPLDKDEE